MFWTSLPSLFTLSNESLSYIIPLIKSSDKNIYNNIFTHTKKDKLLRYMPFPTVTIQMVKILWYIIFFSLHIYPYDYQPMTKINH
jgi:hypothetical protein